jgi:hypothetical protein
MSIALRSLPLVLASFVLLDPSAGSKHHQVTTTANAQARADDQRGSQTSPLFIQVEDAQKEEQRAVEDQRRNEADAAAKVRELRLTLVIALAACIQAFAVCCQIFIYLKQSRLMGGSLRATEKAADAALLNAQAVMNAERAWMVVKGVDGRPLNTNSETGLQTALLSIAFENRGRSPAFLLEYAWKLDSLPVGESLPAVPPPTSAYYVSGSTEDPDGFPLAPDAPYTMRNLGGGVVIPEPQLVAKGEVIMWLHGWVKYRDVFGRIQETWFCYRWHRSTGIVMPYWDRTGLSCTAEQLTNTKPIAKFAPTPIDTGGKITPVRQVARHPRRAFSFKEGGRLTQVPA